MLFYYNTTSSNKGQDNDFNTACRQAGGSSRKTICIVEDEEGVASDGLEIESSSGTRIGVYQYLLVFFAGVSAMFTWV
jgi:hypothetical protein